MEKQRWEESERRSQEVRRSIRERVRRKKMQVREKVGKSPFTAFVPMICGSKGSKSRLAKAAGAEPSGQMRDEKLHAVVAGSTFPSQNVQNTSASEHLEVELSKKTARCCGAKHISKSKCTKHTIPGPLLEVWHVEKVRAVVARRTFPSQKCKNWGGSDHFWRFRCRFVWQAQGIAQLVKSVQT